MTPLDYVVGLDPSMTGTGLAHTIQGEACTHLLSIKPAEGDARLLALKNKVIELIPGAEFVLIEGYLNRSLSAGTTGLVHGAVRVALMEKGIRYATLPPASLKKYAAGKGTASKTEMAVAAYKRGAVEFVDDNQCDAWWLWVAANEYMGHPIFDLPAVNRESLTKIKIEG